MFTHLFEFSPGDPAFAVIDGDCIKRVTVLQYTFETFVGEEGVPVEQSEYVVLFSGGEETAFVLPEDLYATSDEALEAIDLTLMDVESSA